MPLLVVLNLTCRAQVAVDLWSADNGLPQNIIRAICQTPDGYLWLATLDGLVRFDGLQFTTYNRSNTPGIAGNRFNSLYCTSSGDIWTGTEGSGVTHYSQGRFTTYTMQDGLSSDIVLGLSADHQNRLWVLADGKINQWQPASRRFVFRQEDHNTYTDSLSPDGRVGFWSVDDKFLHLFADGQPTRYLLPNGWHPGIGVAAGLDLNDHVWIADAKGILTELTDGHWSVRAGVRRPEEPAATPYRDSRGNIWRAEMGWHANTGVLRYLVLPSGAQPPRICFNTFFEDKEGNVWLSTDGQGLYRLRSQTITVQSTEQGLPDRNVYPVFESRDKSMWVGTWSGGVCRIKDGNLTTFTTANGLASLRVTSIGEDRRGVLWVAVEHGLHRFLNGRFESVRTPAVDFNQRVVRAIHEDPEGVMWFGTQAGLIRLEKGVWRQLTRRDGLATDDARTIIDGRNGELWVGGYGGLSSLQKGRVQAFTERDGLPSNNIRALYQDASRVLWIGTYDGGLGRLENGRFTRYTVRDGLFNNGVFQILEDSEDHLWMSCNQGIYRVNKKQLNDFAARRTRAITSVVYGKRDGMRNIECNGGLWPAGSVAADGRLWFPTQDGVAVIDPKKMARDSRTPPALIESCLVDHVSVPVDRPFRLTPGRENLEIHYTALSLTDSEHIRFKYRMLGADDDWVDAGTRRAAYYPHLPPGRYTFRVAAAHGDGVWNEAGAGLTIIVLPPFYRTWWFVSLLIATGSCSLWFAWRRRLDRLEKARAAQQAFSRQLIASQEGERKRIAAELHDSLGQRLVIIKNLALLLRQNRNSPAPLNRSQSEQLEEILTEVSGAASEVKEIAYNLRPYRLDRLGLTAALRALVQSASAASSIAFSAEIEDIDNAFPKDAEINFYRILQESVNNILEHSDASQALIRISRTRDGVTLVVRDNGSGFVHDSIQPDSTRGFGLTGISERAQLLGGNAVIHSTPGQGTIVTIEVGQAGLSHA
ncbi:MAG TPA: two-component regulator propeller domain-containing protein [Bryobacteraceae bacterium]